MKEDEGKKNKNTHTHMIMKYYLWVFVARALVSPHIPLFPLLSLDIFVCEKSVFLNQKIII